MYKSVAVVLDLGDFSVELLESSPDFEGYLPGQLDVGVHFQEERHHQVFVVGHVDQIVLVVVVDCLYLRVRLRLQSGESYFFEVALGLLDGRDEHGGGLDVLFAVLGGDALADEDALAVRENDALEAVELLDYPFEKLGALSSH